MYTLSCFADEISPRLDAQLELMAHLGIRYMSLRSVDDVNVLDLTDARIDQIALELDKRHMAVSSIGSPVGKTQISNRSDLYLDQTQRAIAIARRIDCPRIRVFSFYMPADRLDEERAEVIRRLSEMARLAARDGIELLHENEAGIYGETSVRCRDLLDAVNLPNFNAAFDPSNFVAAGEAPFDQSLPNIRPYVSYMHIKDSRRNDNVIVPAGEGDAQLADILPVFADHDMFLTLEPHLALAGRNRGFTGEDLFCRAHAALTGLLNRLKIAYN